MLQIENQYISASFALKGAELTSLIFKENGANYLWDGNPEFWGKHSPILFPIVGGLKNNTYKYNDVAYMMSRHGFARDSIFTLFAHNSQQIVFELVSNEFTLKQYPFHFKLYITYTLIENRLEVSYKVENTTDGDLLFSIGAHPAFAVPLYGGNVFENCRLEFSDTESSSIFPLDENGQILIEPITFLHNSNTILLTKELFNKDALIFTDLKSKFVSLVSSDSNHGLKISLDGFPYLGIWSTKNADFVCIEPWCGLADFVDATGNLSDKRGIMKLAKGKSWQILWSVTVF